MRGHNAVHADVATHDVGVVGREQALLVSVPEVAAVADWNLLVRQPRTARHRLRLPRVQVAVEVNDTDGPAHARNAPEKRQSDGVIATL